MNRLGQLIDRSRREIEAKRPLTRDNEYWIVVGSYLLGALRLWAQTSGRTDDDVRAVLEGDDESLHIAGDELAAVGTDEATEGAHIIGGVMRLVERERWTIMATAARVWFVLPSE